MREVGGELIFVRDRVDARQLVLERRHPELVQLFGVHEGVVEIGDLLLVRAVLEIGHRRHILDDRLDVLAGLVAKIIENPGVVAVGRDFGRLQPGPVDVPEKVVLWPDRRVHVVEVDSTGQRHLGLVRRLIAPDQREQAHDRRHRSSH